jgi:hypothetical protein
MLAPDLAEASSRVITTFIHDLRPSAGDERGASPAFRGLPAQLVVGKASPAGRGVIVHRNYIEAALIAHLHAPSLDNLITVESLVRVTCAALAQFRELDFAAEGKGASGDALRRQYREDAEEVCRTLARAGSPAGEAGVAEIRRLLERE